MGMLDAPARTKTKGITTGAPFYATAELNFAVKGIDAVDDRIFAIDNSSNLVMSTDRGVTWSNSKGLPANVSGTTVTRITRWGGLLWLVGFDSVASAVKVYSATPAPNLNDPITWNYAGLTLTAGSLSTAPFQVGPSNWGSNDALIITDYGPDPTGGPSMWRTTDGTTWTKVLGPIAGTRHFHHIFPDPYAPGNWWLTAGDGTGFELARSVDNGLTWTWLSTSPGSTVDLSQSIWQAVTITADANALYFMGDSGYFSNFKLRRSDIAAGTYKPIICPSWHQNLRILNGVKPGRGPFTDGGTTAGSKNFTSATANFTSNDVGRVIGFNASFNPGGYPGVMRFWIVSVTNSTTVVLNAQANSTTSGITFTLSEEQLWHGAVYGAVDPTTGIIYQLANDSTSSGGRTGFFCTMPDGTQRLLESWGPSYSTEVFLYQGYVYCGRMKRQLLTLDNWQS